MVAFLDRLVPLCRGIRLAFERALHTGSVETVDPQRVEEEITVAVLEALAPFFLQFDQLGEPAPRAEGRAWAEEQWNAMEPLAAADQKLVASTLLSERTWALAVRICEASAAAQNPAEALRLAQLAVDLAGELPKGPWRLRLLGWCEPFLAAARRAGGDLNAAREGFARADEHWKQGAGSDPTGLLDGSRRPCP